MVGIAYATFGRRDAVLAVLDRFVEPTSVEATFHEQIGLTGPCGRELAAGAAPQIPDPAARPRQVRTFGRNWAALFREDAPASRGAELASGLRALSGHGSVTVLLMPFRADFRAYLEDEYPGLLERRRATWARAASDAQVRALDCSEAMEDDSLFEDPVHLHEGGRSVLSAYAASELGGKRGRCAALVAPAGPMTARE
jgi:hypothetical protein